MKKIFLVLLIPCYCLSQNNISTLNYDLIRTKGQFTFNADGILEIDSKNNISKFKLSQYVNLLKPDDFVKDITTENDSIKVVGAKKICQDDKIYYNDFKKDSTYSILYDTRCKSKVLIKDIINYPKWEIKNEFKKIGDYNVQKATAFINDRTWTAFFTNELGINGGPWKLIGLPGLVLEATATENTSTYEFRLTKINKNIECFEITKPYYKNQTTFNEFEKKSIERYKEQMFFIFSQVPGALVDEIDKNSFKLYETLDFIEKRD
ncbi:GLPGLI family protein [Gillisia sp. Hel_I_86]|uniref:GLPGLI family protein n=1 Tax=Gillisia sp. Hel_I_86 TaxID=1249981 RepID=UPI00119C3C3A|nr:GLPGLI family protein [Gillisia sp. Hel_I_86]TVZ27865.1 GLPGLI family protein [Gillisia sp. Hel_I_86]